MVDLYSIAFQWDLEASGMDLMYRSIFEYNKNYMKNKVKQKIPWCIKKLKWKKKQRFRPLFRTVKAELGQKQFNEMKILKTKLAREHYR